MNELGFQRAVERIRQSDSGEELATSVRVALTGMLGKPEDRGLLASLTAQAESITGRLPRTAPGKQSDEIRQAAIRCVLLLESAKNGRTGSGPAFFKDRRVIIVIAVTAIVAAFYVWLLI